MEKVAIKICGLRFVESAVYAVRAGADFIGLVFHPESKRNVDMDSASEIAEAVSFNGGIPVAVVANQDASEIMKLCKKTGINHVQFHGKTAIANLPYVGDDIVKILSVKVSADGVMETPYADILQSLDPRKDYLLYDGQNPGSGVRFPIEKLYPIPGFRFFIAGGLDADNISETIDSLHPYGVDVSSGVEAEPGVKDPVKIDQFINQVNHIKG